MDPELGRLVISFRADVMAEIAAHRDGEQTGDVIDSFARKVAKHRDRYLEKLTGFYTKHEFATVNQVERQIEAFADAEIRRARTEGRVEFAA